MEVQTLWSVDFCYGLKLCMSKVGCEWMAEISGDRVTGIENLSFQGTQIEGRIL